MSTLSCLLLSGWVAMRAASPASAQALQESQATLTALPRDSFTLAQLNHIFDAARVQMGTAVESARSWIQRGPSAAMHGAGAPNAARTRDLSRTPVVPPPPPAPSYERTFRILLRHPEKTDRYDALIVKYSDRYGLDPRLVKAIIAAESEFTPTARSPRGAMGLMQLMPRTAEMFVHLPWRGALSQPEINIAAGVGYLVELFNAAWKRFKLKGVAFKDAPPWLVQRIIAAYNAGPKFLFRREFFKQTRRYVAKVLRFYRSKVTELRVPAPPAPNAQPAGSLIALSGTFY